MRTAGHGHYAVAMHEPQIVAAALGALWPGRFDHDPLPEAASLGEGGLELDSIEIAELVLECEERLGLPGSRAQQLLEAGPLTVGDLIDYLAAVC
jgi:acyl carrier protein